VTGDRHRPALAIGYVNAALVFYVLQDALVRYLTAGYPVFQIQFTRSAVMATVMAGAILATRRLTDFRPKRPGLLLFRGYTSLVGVALMFLVLAKLELAQAFTIFMTGPVFVALLGIVMLKERVKLGRWAAIGVGILGVVVILQPGSGVAPEWALVALLGAAVYALAMVTTRDLTRTESSQTIVLFTNLFVAAVLLPAQPWVWTPPPLADLALLMGVGVLATLAQFLLAQAYRHASAATVAPFDYVAFVYVVIVGYLMFGEVPSCLVVAGAGVVMMSGFLIIRSETRRQ
jgi:S-adenosylmethionine uptake transporter